MSLWDWSCAIHSSMAQICVRSACDGLSHSLPDVADRPFHLRQTSEPWMPRMIWACWFRLKYMLIGGFKSSEKYEFVNWDDEIPNIWENKKCSKPLTCMRKWWTMETNRWIYKSRFLIMDSERSWHIFSNKNPTKRGGDLHPRCCVEIAVSDDRSLALWSYVVIMAAGKSSGFLWQTNGITIEHVNHY